MIHRIKSLILLLALYLSISEYLGGDTPQHKFKHQWERIHFPSIRLPNSHFEISYVIQSVNSHIGLQVEMTVTFSYPTPQWPPREFDDSMESPNEKAKIRLIQESGDVIPCEDLTSNRGSINGFKAYSRSTSAYFPWKDRCLESVWVEISFEEHRHFLELPYGFTCHPDSSHTSDTNFSGPPTFPIKDYPLKKTDHIISWEAVDYEYGEIKNGQHLSLIQSNPGDGYSELVLYREDSAVGKSIYLWELDTPKTTLKIQDMLGNVSLERNRQMGIRLHEDGMRRSDTFKWFRKGDTKRSWMKMVIGVDGDSYALMIPTSMYQFVHGQSRNHLER